MFRAKLLALAKFPFSKWGSLLTILLTAFSLTAWYIWQYATALDAVQVGIHKKDVLRLLGEPTVHASPFNSDSLVAKGLHDQGWTGDLAELRGSWWHRYRNLWGSKEAVLIVFDKDGKVVFLFSVAAQ